MAMNVDLTKLDTVAGITLQDLKQREGIMPPLNRTDEEEDHTSEQNEVEGPIGPTDQFHMPLKFAYRRAFSEMELLDSLGGATFQEGMCYCFMSRGDVDLSSYLKLILKQQNVPELIVSSWRADLSDFEMLKKWKQAGRIGKVDVFLGRLYAYGSERRYNITTFREMVKDFPDITVKVFRNHSKIIAGKGEKYNFVVQSSANMNTNVNAENCCIIIDKDCFDFYRKFFSDIKTLI